MSLAALHTLWTADPAWLGTLAQSARAARARQDIWFWLIVLVVLSVLIIAAGIVARKFFAGPLDTSDADATFDLSELRRLHREGQLSDQEYQAARAIALRDAAGYLGDAPPPADGPEPPPAPASTPPAGADPDPADVELGPELLDRDDEPPGPEKPDKPGRGPGPPDRKPWDRK